MRRLTVGQVAREAGVNLQTIHYYERRALLPEAARSDSNYRLYPEEAVRRTRFIKRAQRVGFTLEEIRELISLRAESVDQCGRIQQAARVKLDEIDEKIRELRSISSKLRRLISRCEAAATSPDSECPIVAALDSEEDE